MAIIEGQFPPDNSYRTTIYAEIEAKKNMN